MRRTAVIVSWIAATAAIAQSDPPATRPVEALRALATRTIAGLGLSNAEEAARLTEATTAYLTSLDAILTERAATLQKLGATAARGDGQAVAQAYVAARDQYMPLKRMFVVDLNATLVPYQVERVKDGLTGDALPKLYAMYCNMIPGLRPEERAHVMGLLVEMRENAMTAVEAGAQEQWQDKYRGKINNYIAAQGHDFKKLSKAWDAANRGRR